MFSWFAAPRSARTAWLRDPAVVVGLVALMVAITAALYPSRQQTTGRAGPTVLAKRVGSAAALFALLEWCPPAVVFKLSLLWLPAFGAGKLATGGVVVAALPLWPPRRPAGQPPRPCAGSAALRQREREGPFCLTEADWGDDQAAPASGAAGAGIIKTFQDFATVLSSGLFCSTVTAGLASALPSTLGAGLSADRVAVREAVARFVLPLAAPFAFFHRDNPPKPLLGPKEVGRRPSPDAATLTAKTLFLQPLSPPCGRALSAVFACACRVVVAVAATRPSSLSHQRERAKPFPPKGTSANGRFPAPAAEVWAR